MRTVRLRKRQKRVSDVFAEVRIKYRELDGFMDVSNKCDVRMNVINNY